MKSTRRGITLLLCGLLACKGADGAIGPPGPAGPGTRLDFTGAIPAGGAVTVTLPAAAGTLAKPPLFACYLYFSGAGTSKLWIPTGGPDAPGASCYVSAQDVGAPLTLTLDGAAAGQGYYIIVIY